MKIIIIGGGQIGCYIATQFAIKTKHEIFLLARSTYPAIKKNGITVTDVEANTTYHTDRIMVCNDIDQLPQANLIILATKTSQNSALLSNLARLCLSGAPVVTLQNGLDFEEEIAHSVQHHSLYSGTCWIKVTTKEPSHIRHEFGKNIKLGCYSSEKLEVAIQPRDKVIKIIFEKAGLVIDLVTNIKSVQLTKLALNIPFFILSAVYGNSISEILSNPSIDAQRKKLQAEIVHASSLLGSPVDIVFIEGMVTKLRKMPVTVPISRSQLAASMKQELPLNVNTLLRLMSQHNISLPLLEEYNDVIFLNPKNELDTPIILQSKL